MLKGAKVNNMISVACYFGYKDESFVPNVDQRVCWLMQLSSNSLSLNIHAERGTDGFCANLFQIEKNIAPFLM
jgi:hypothetical protein